MNHLVTKVLGLLTFNVKLMSVVDASKLSFHFFAVRRVVPFFTVAMVKIVTKLKKFQNSN